MNESLIKDVAWTGEDYLGSPITAIILRFSGLGGTQGMKSGAEPQELEWANAGGLIVLPYHNPWAWMNQDAIDFVDELTDALLKKYNLPSSLPIIATGGSMGGHGALTYTLKSRHKVTRCLAICPVANLLYHYSERRDLPRTMHSAYRSYGNIEEKLKEYSPLHQADRMPDIPYLIIHGEKDQAVAKAHHSDPFCRALKQAGRNLTYLELPNMEHCGPWDYASFQATTDFVKAGLRQ